MECNQWREDSNCSWKDSHCIMNAPCSMLHPVFCPKTCNCLKCLFVCLSIHLSASLSVCPQSVKIKDIQLLASVPCWLRGVLTPSRYIICTLSPSALLQVPSEKLQRAGKVLRNAILSRAPHMIRDRKYHLKTYRWAGWWTPGEGMHPPLFGSVQTA